MSLRSQGVIVSHSDRATGKIRKPNLKVMERVRLSVVNDHDFTQIGLDPSLGTFQRFKFGVESFLEEDIVETR